MPLFSIRTDGDTTSVAISRKLPAYARGAALAATLARPPVRSDDQGTHKAYLAYCRIVLQAVQQLDPDWQNRPQAIIPEHLAFPLARAEELERDLRHEIEKSLGAADAAAPFPQEAEART